MQMLPKIKTGLVLEGGAMRGLFTAGALDVFMERGITFDGLIGVSAGACFGCNYKSGQIGRVIRYNKRFARDPRYCSWRSLFTTGDLFGAEFCYRELPKKLDVFDAAAFEANPMEFHIVATDAATGKPVYKRLDRADDTALDWIRASASMPIVSRPVEIDGRKYLDGGLSDGIPLKYFEIARICQKRSHHHPPARIPQVPARQSLHGETVSSALSGDLPGAQNAARLVQRDA
jgi:predicted patatin/cPLA2 family phospholipase